jgi:hypothetical protein
MQTSHQQHQHHQHQPPPDRSHPSRSTQDATPGTPSTHYDQLKLSGIDSVLLFAVLGFFFSIITLIVVLVIPRKR